MQYFGGINPPQPIANNKLTPKIPPGGVPPWESTGKEDEMTKSNQTVKIRSPRQSFTFALAARFSPARGFKHKMSIPLLFVLAIVILYLLNSINILKEYERGVVFYLGRVNQTAAGPGVVFV